MRRYLLDCWKVIAAYAGIVAVFSLFCVLYGLDCALIGDFVRFTWLFFAAAVLLRIMRTRRTVRQIEGDDIAGVKGGSLVERECLDRLRLERDRLNRREQQMREEFKDRYDYLTVWSHEMKTPLAALKLMADASDAVESSRVQRQVAKAEYQLNLLLNYERLSDFNHDLEFAPVDLLDLLQQVLRDNLTLLTEKDLVLDVDVPHVCVLTDRKWLAFILGQILTNAGKYSAPHQQVRIGYEDGVLSIADSGIGISSSDLPRIFEKGFTGENGRRSGAATGMGLYIVKRVSEFLKIDVDVESAPGAGTVVRLNMERALHLNENNKL